MSSVEAIPVVRKTALNPVHRQMGAKMVDFNGWDMPVEYPASIGCGIINEHMAVRTGVGIFDVSHMGDIRLAGAHPRECQYECQYRGASYTSCNPAA